MGHQVGAYKFPRVDICRQNPKRHVQDRGHVQLNRIQSKHLRRVVHAVDISKAMRLDGAMTHRPKRLNVAPVSQATSLSVQVVREAALLIVVAGNRLAGAEEPVIAATLLEVEVSVDDHTEAELK